jgi:hypothetical protein
MEVSHRGWPSQRQAAQTSAIEGFSEKNTLAVWQLQLSLRMIVTGGLLLVIVARVSAALDADCGFNGMLTSGTCTCTAPWHGRECSSLNLLPVNLNQRGLKENGKSTWGGSILKGKDDAKWYMWAAEMVDGCGLTSWTRQYGPPSGLLLCTSIGLIGLKNAVGIHDVAWVQAWPSV